MASFGFTPDNSDEAERNNNDGSVDFAAMMKAMQQQIQEEFSKFGMGGSGFVESNEALPKNTVRDTAKKFVTAKGSDPMGANDVANIEQAFSIAELWLNEAILFEPINIAANCTLARRDWVDSTIAGWQSTVEPLALGLTQAITELLNKTSEQAQGSPESAGQIPLEMISTMLRSFIGTLMATQLGQSIGGLAATVTGIHDVGLPLVHPVYPALVPQNINEWATDLNIPIDEVRIFHALRESAGARLFAHNPWLVAYIHSAISDYGKGINIDIDAIAQKAQELFEASADSSGEFDPTNPESFTMALNEGIFTPAETPAQREALTKLEVVLALVDGWNESVVGNAAKDRLPNISAMQEVLRRKRATSAPTAQLFSNLFGLQVSPRLAREAAAFWASVVSIRDIQSRDHIWSGILPTAEDLMNPESYLKSIEIPEDLSSL